MAIAVDSFFLAPDAKGTLQAQIQQMIAENILSGRFRPGEKMPSSRALATHLGVSRITVTLAYTELVASDYLASRARSGYFISDEAPVPPSYDPQPRGEDRVNWAQVLNRFSDGDTPQKPADWAEYKYPFIYGQVDGALFDHANWRACALRALGQRDFRALSADLYDQDDPQLIEYIARHTLPRRGILAHPDEILITLGAQNALWLAAQLLLGPGRRAVVEDPTYYGLRDLLAHQGCDVTELPVDRDGLPPDQIEAADVIFTTPSHQCPTTATMPMPRRQALLQRARELDALIVEDDYEFEMAFLGAPSPALKSLDTDGRVIYVGSFSKSLFPGLRLGYLVASAPMIREARALRASLLRHPPGLLQRSAAYFLSLGHYDAQVRRMSRALLGRREALEAAISLHGLQIAGRGVFGGSSLWMEAPDHVDTAQLSTDLRAHKVYIEPGAPFFAGADKPKNYYRLGYSAIPADRIHRGIEILAEALEPSGLKKA
ncbi:MAG: PLP-dependent aminotransferase family protein [Rhodobacteraceae bacterium]|nr:PLP-dependent aminotransferase family protein [Paracoccaceae bacterium]